MSDFLKGSYDLEIEVDDEPKKEAQLSEKTEDYRKKALGSIGGSMVFVEREMLSWEGSESGD